MRTVDDHDDFVGWLSTTRPDTFSDLWAEYLDSLPGPCICPEVWDGVGEPRPDPKRPDPDCPLHGVDSDD